MSFIRLCTLALIVSASLAACNSYGKVSLNNKAHVVQASEAIIGEVTEVITQDREQQTITLMAKDGRTYKAFISKTNFGQENSYQIQKLAIGDYIEVMGEQLKL